MVTYQYRITVPLSVTSLSLSLSLLLVKWTILIQHTLSNQYRSVGPASWRTNSGMASTSVSPPNCMNGRYYYTTADQYIRPKYNTQYTSHCKLREASIYLVSSSFFSSLSFSFCHTRLERELLLFIFSLLLFLLLLLHLPHSPSLFSLFIPFPVNSPWERPETGLQSRRFRSIEIPVDLFFQPAAPVLLPKLCLATLASTSLFCSTFVSSNGELSIPLKSYRRCHFPSSDLWPRRLRFPPSPSQLLPVRRDDRTGWNISFRAFSSLVSSLVFVFGVHDFGCVCSWKVRNFTFFFFFAFPSLSLAPRLQLCVLETLEKSIRCAPWLFKGRIQSPEALWRHNAPQVRNCCPKQPSSPLCIVPISSWIESPKMDEPVVRHIVVGERTSCRLGSRGLARWNGQPGA